MYAALKRLLWLNRIEAVTAEDVEPALVDKEQEQEIKTAQVRLIQEVMALERKSWEVREELANNVIHIVSGD